MGNKRTGKLKDLTYDKLNQLYQIENKTFRNIAKIYGASEASVCARANKLGICSKPRSAGKLSFLTYEILYEMYTINGMTLDSIGEMLGVTSGCISARAKRLGFEVNSKLKKSKIINSTLKIITYEVLHQLYCIEEKSFNDIAIIFNLKYPYVSKHAKKLGISIRPYAKLKHITPEILNQLHWVEEKSMCDISEIYNCTTAALRKIAKKLNIETRDNASAAKLAFSGDKSHFWKGGITSLKSQIRTSPTYDNWRKACYARDKCICAICSATKNDLVDFNVDHIKPFSTILYENNIQTIEQAIACSELWDISNGRVLCVPCHRGTDTYGFKAKNYVPPLQDAIPIIGMINPN